MTLGIAAECAQRQEELVVKREYNQMHNAQAGNDLQNLGTQQEADLYMGNKCQIDMSDGVNPHENYSDKTDGSIGLSSSQQPRPSAPPTHLSLMFVFQPALEEQLQDSGKDELKGDDTNDVVIFKPDIEPDTPVVDHGHLIKNPLLHIVEEARKLDQMRRIDDLGYSIA